MWPLLSKMNQRVQKSHNATSPYKYQGSQEAIVAFSGATCQLKQPHH